MEPGDSAEISVALDTTGKFGNVHKTVTIKTNDPARPSVDVPLSAVVEHSMAVEEGQPLESVLFGEECGECHSAPAAGLTGAAVYTAICEMCHGPWSEYATSLPPDVIEREALRAWVAEGKGELGMPGYAAPKGGPLTEEQIDTLVDALRAEAGEGAGS